MERYLLGHTLKEFIRFRRLAPWLFVMVLIYVLGRFWGGLLPGSLLVDQYSQISSMIVFRMLALCSAVYATAVISQEVEQKTIVYLLTRPIPRQTLILARYAAMAIVVGCISVASAVALSFGVYGSSALVNPLLMKDIQALLIGALAYGGLFLFVSLLFNRAMLICLLFAFGWETSVPNMPGELYRLSVFSYLQAIAEHPQSQEGGKTLMALVSGTLGTNTLSRGGAMTSMVLLITGALAISAWWFSRFEYVPREDAE